MRKSIATDRKNDLLTWALVAVGAGAFLLQVLLSGIGRPAGFDEAVYLSQVDPQVPAVFLSAHRARGASLLAWPAVALGAPMPLVRAWLAFVSSTGLVIAFRPWIRTLGWSAPVAAALYAGWWVSALFGNEVESNAVAALATIAAVGLAVQPPDHTRWRLPGLAASTAVIVLFRPTDIAWLGLTLALCLPVLRGRQSFAALVAAGAGAVAGLVPWVVEAFARFGGPAARLAAVEAATVGAGGVEGSGPLLRVLQYLSLLDGPSALTSRSPPQAYLEPVVPAQMWVGGVLLVALIGVGVVRPHAPAGVAGVRTSAVGGLLFLLAYVALTGFVHLRFLLPAWGLLAIPAAAGLHRILRGGRPLAVVALGCLLLVGAGQVATLRHEAAVLSRTRGEIHALGAAAGRMVERPCHVYAERDFPIIALASGCGASRLRPSTGEPPDDEPAYLAAHGGARGEGVHVYALAPRVAPPVDRWPSRPVGDQRGYRLYAGPGPRGPHQTGSVEAEPN